MSTQNSAQNQAKYFDLHVHGIGYLNNVRIVPPTHKKAQPFVACRIAALVGESGDPEYRYFDVNVVGVDTEKLIKKCAKAVEEGKKVLISFVLGDLWVDKFFYKTDSEYHKKGDAGFSLKGRLIRVKMIKIDGELKYLETSSSDNGSPAPADTPTSDDGQQTPAGTPESDGGNPAEDAA